MKIIILIIILILSTFNNQFVNSQQNITTTTFIPTTDCFTKQGCSIFSNSTYWDNKNAFNSPQSTDFMINFQNGQTATLLIDIDFNVNSLKIDFSELTTSNIVTFNSSKFNSNNIQIVYVTNLLFNNAIVTTQTIELVGTVTQLKGNSKLTTTSNSSSVNSPDFVVDNLSNLSIYDNSNISANYLTLEGLLLLSDSSSISVSNTLTSEIGFVSHANTTINSGGSIILSGVQQYNLYGVINSINIDIDASTVVSISNTLTSKLNIKSNSVLNTTPNSKFVVTDDISINGNLTLGVNSTFTAHSDSLQTVTGVVTITDNTNLNIANLEFPGGSIISKTSQTRGVYSNITVTSGVVNILGYFDQDDRIFGGITVADNASLYAFNQLFLEGCIYVSGYASISVSVICNNDYMYIYQSGTIDLLPHSNSYAYLIYNYGIMDTLGTNVTLHGNIMNYGELNIGVDSNINLVGYMDCMDSSTINIQGLGPNTPKPALKVRDILTMAGSLIYNISAPPMDEDSVYSFIQSEIQLDGNFTSFSPSEYSYEITYFSFVTPKDYKYPDTLEVVFNFAKDKHHLHPVLILISIVSPLIVIGFLVLVIYKVKQYKQRRGYAPLSSNDKILNDSSLRL